MANKSKFDIDKEIGKELKKLCIYRHALPRPERP